MVFEWIMTSEYYTKCPECESHLIHDNSKGEYICQNCGYVVMDQAFDYGPESHSSDFEEKSKNIRASGHTSISLHDYGLRTEIGIGSKDYSGKAINHQIAEQMNNMRRWHSRIRVASPKERRLSNVLSKINEICSAMSLSKTLIETAAMLYRNFENKNEAKGKSIACIAAATIYLACKRCSIVRSLEEIIKAAGITDEDRSSLKLASKYYRMMVIEMGVFMERDQISMNLTPSITLTTGHTSPSLITQSTPIAIYQYISKLSNMAKIDTKVERLAIDIAHKTNNNLITDGKAPNGLAAAYIYLSAILLGVNLLQMDISTLAGITEVTIRNRCKDILTNFKLKIRVRPVARATLDKSKTDVQF
jgi:transcription initiation factor TFIIB